MALTTYTELKASIASWLRRDDLTTVIPDFISLAESQINRRLRVRRMVTTTTLTLNAEYVNLPTDYAGVKSIEVDYTPPVTLEFLEQDQFARRTAYIGQSTPPAYYTIVGSQVRLFPDPTGTGYTATLTYWQRIPALSGSNATNWLLDTAPDAYLYGALLQSAPYLRADPRIETWSSLYLASLQDLKDADQVESLGAVLTPIPSTVV